MQDLEQTIRERAYQLWIESGCQHGNADTHWLAAQREVVGASLSWIARVTATANKPKAPRGKSASRKRSVA
jgi:Protein of unknown function (DUF2934)